MFLVFGVQRLVFFCHIPVLNHNFYPFDDNLARLIVALILDFLFNYSLLLFPLFLNSEVPGI